MYILISILSYFVPQEEEFDKRENQKQDSHRSRHPESVSQSRISKHEKNK